MSFGPSKKDLKKQQDAQIAAAKANAPKPMPDMADAAVRQARADALKALQTRRGAASTIFNHKAASGRVSDQNGSPIARSVISRG